MVNVAILGYGTVGSGVAKVLTDNKDIIAKRAGKEINVKYILDLREFPGDPNENKVVHDFNTILNDPEVSIVCETMGGTKPAYDFSLACLKAGKCVCTSNKELVESLGTDLMEAARDNNCRYLFEASVGGGIPVIRTMADSLTAENISAITGILNGTTNYILTRMDKEGIAFEDVLKDAQKNGYAEKDPTADIEGHDACRKIAILTSLVLGKKVDHNHIPTQGITKITSADFSFAKAVGCSIKLLAMSSIQKDGVWARVAPHFVSASHPLYCVNDVFNAVHIHSDMLDDSMYYGRGAGMLATASAVCSDVIDCACNPDKTGRAVWTGEEVSLLNPDKVTAKFFLRVNKSELSQQELETALGKDLRFIECEDCPGEYGAITPSMEEGTFSAKTASLKGICSVIRVFE